MFGKTKNGKGIKIDDLLEDDSDIPVKIDHVVDMLHWRFHIIMQTPISIATVIFIFRELLIFMYMQSLHFVMVTDNITLDMHYSFQILPGKSKITIYTSPHTYNTIYKSFHFQI